MLSWPGNIATYQRVDGLWASFQKGGPGDLLFAFYTLFHGTTFAYERRGDNKTSAAAYSTRRAERSEVAT